MLKSVNYIKILEKLYIWYIFIVKKMKKNKDNNGLAYGRGYVYSLQYHIIWCTKYRKQVLTNDIAELCKKYIDTIANDYSFKIMEKEVMPDHIHLLIDAKPQFIIPDMVKILKGNTARWIFIKHPELKKELYGGHLWNPSYCVTTVSERSIEQIKHYIQNQTK